MLHLSISPLGKMARPRLPVYSTGGAQADRMSMTFTTSSLCRVEQNKRQKQYRCRCGGLEMNKTLTAFHKAEACRSAARTILIIDSEVRVFLATDSISVAIGWPGKSQVAWVLLACPHQGASLPSQDWELLLHSKKRKRDKAAILQLSVN